MQQALRLLFECLTLLIILNYQSGFPVPCYYVLLGDGGYAAKIGTGALPE
jgi:hypothetical protein